MSINVVKKTFFLSVRVITASSSYFCFLPSSMSPCLFPSRSDHIKPTVRESAVSEAARKTYVLYILSPKRSIRDLAYMITVRLH